MASVAVCVRSSRSTGRSVVETTPLYTLHLLPFPLSVEFGTFDILTDEEVRQGLKKFSNWPTYPQLYVNGQLIGGLDIVKVKILIFLEFVFTCAIMQELKEAGELETTLSSNDSN